MVADPGMHHYDTVSGRPQTLGGRTQLALLVRLPTLPGLLLDLVNAGCAIVPSTREVSLLPSPAMERQATAGRSSSRHSFSVAAAWFIV
jgi:hypothetical protein